MFTLRIILLLSVSFLMFKFYGITGGILGLIISLVKILYSLGYMKSIKIFKRSFTKGIVFTKDYKGSYKNLQIAFNEVNTLKEKFHLDKSYKIICFFYDNHKVEESKKRSSIGLYKKQSSNDDKIDLNLEDFCKDKNNGFKITVFENSVPSLYSNWDFVNFFSMMIGIKKFYDELHDSLKNKYFRRNYKIENEDIKVCVELFESDSNMTFYVPLNQIDNFLIHDDFKQEKKE